MTPAWITIAGFRHRCVDRPKRLNPMTLAAMATVPTPSPMAGPTPGASPMSGVTKGKITYVSVHLTPDTTIDQVKARSVEVSGTTQAKGSVAVSVTG